MTGDVMELTRREGTTLLYGALAGQTASAPILPWLFGVRLLPAPSKFVLCENVVFEVLALGLNSSSLLKALAPASSGMSTRLSAHSPSTCKNVKTQNVL